MRKISLLLIIFIASIFSNSVESSSSPPITQGMLKTFTKDGKALGNSPLKHTKVKTDISGFLARVTVEQEFENNFDQPIEAVYTFPLSQNSAVDDMTMKIGSRVIRGKIKKREEARKLYEQAKSKGKTASLLDQERPNIFTQSVANILPNEKIVIEISYVETLKYEDGSYEFVFPMVVGPRYSPASVKKEDAAKVSPPVAVKTRAGHDISIDVDLDAGVPIENISSQLHEINTQNLSSNSAKISLQNERTIPNKDFILRYDVTGKRIEDAILTHRDERGGFFTMMLAPPEDFGFEDVSPKEIIFVLDTSGSMGGFPIEKAKEAMKMSLEGLYPNDTFNLITFAGDTHVLFDEPVPATPANLERAKNFLATRQGGGGTEMMKAIKAALKPSGSNEHLRIVNFMTDGYVSNESQIIAEIKKHQNARVFSFGIGNGVNRFLLDKMAEEGRGEVQYVTLNSDGSKAAKNFHERIRNPLLTDISVDWNGMPVADVYPKRNPDLWDAKPVVIHGRYKNGANGTIKLKGKVGGQDFVREINVNLPETEESHDVLSTLWARTRIDDLTSKSLTAQNTKREEIEKTIANLGLEFRLLTDYTSFVAVEDIVRTQGDKPVKIEVPVDLADGTFNSTSDGKGTGEGSGIGSGSGNGTGTGRTPGLTKIPSVGNLYKRKQSTTKSGGTGSGGGMGSGSGSGSGKVSGMRASSTTVTISGGKTTLNTTSSQINSLPINGRNISSLLQLSPGVVANPNGSGFSIDGASGAANTFIIDGSEITNFHTGNTTLSPTFTINGATGNKLFGRIKTVKSPEYPKDSKEKGIVQVQVKVDEKGNVSEAKAISGHPNLKTFAEKATREWKFVPTKFSNINVKLTGEVIYEFVDKKTIKLAVDKMRVADLTEEQKLKMLSYEKLHIWIYEWFENSLNKASKLTRHESKFIKGKKAYLQVWLNKNDKNALAELKRIGFKTSSKRNKNIVIGKIKTKRIKDLIGLKQVKYILPSAR